jgi:Ni/Fe-hydrogenase subunit HybB-like protein
VATNSIAQANVINRKPEQIREDLLRPLFHTSRRFYILVFLLVAIGLPGIFMYANQMLTGMGVAGITRPVFWGIYIANFVFWIGISHAGTLISAILRLVNAGWRRPVTRCAEAITVFALAIGAQYPIIHLGRSWVFFWLIPYPSERGIWPNFRSPLAWDFFAISTYLTGSVAFLLLPIIPDWAMVRDRATGLRHRIYTILALGWRGTPREWHRLEVAMRIMAVVILPVAVSVHTIVSWDFAMAPVPMWHSTVFGPYFVAGAIFSGIAALIIAMALLRKALHLEEYLKPIHFDHLGKLLLLMSLLWIYFIFAERLTVWYGNQPAEMAAFWSIQRGRFAILFWTMVSCNFLIPFPILAIKKLRTITGTVIASSTVVVGMWLERFLIVVPPLERKYLPYDWGRYHASMAEIMIAIGTMCGMILLYLLFAKFIPMISIWELRGGQRAKPQAEHAQSAASLSQARLDSALPPASS